MRATEARRALLAALPLLVAAPLRAQDRVPPRRAEPAFRFSTEAGHALRRLWETSVAAQQERVACLGAVVRNDSVFVNRLLPLEPADADSMTIASDESVERCGPPEWSGTVHSHVADYDNGLPSTTFSAQDRGVMRRWYERWKVDGVFCVVYSRQSAHCEADGVIGGIRARPTVKPVGRERSIN
jgi:hypothetical protein